MIAYVEAALPAPGDPFLRGPDGDRAIFCENSVLYWEHAAAGADGITRLFNGATWDPNVGILVAAGHQPRPRETIGVQALRKLAQAAFAIVVGIWDGEGLLFWETAAPAS